MDTSVEAIRQYCLRVLSACDPPASLPGAGSWRCSSPYSGLQALRKQDKGLLVAFLKLSKGGCAAVVAFLKALTVTAT